MKICILIIGAPRTGKTTFATLLAKAMQAPSFDTGRVIAEKFRCMTGTWVDEENKEELRPHLIALGNIICSQQPARLVELIFDKDRATNSHYQFPRHERPTIPTHKPSPKIIIGGIRRQTEFDAAKIEAQARGYTLATVKVIGGPASGVADNYELHDALTDYQIENCSTLDWLKQKAEELALEFSI